jgi:4-hydroxybenzoyl-CoA thioesterase
MVTSKRLIRVEWGDCDPAEIVFYPNYFAWFDACTTQLLASVGLPPWRFRDDFGVMGCPLLEASAKFHIASRFGDEIEAESSVADWAGKAFTVAHHCRRGGQLLLEGRETRIFVTVDPVSGRLESVPVPDEVKRRLGG